MGTGKNGGGRPPKATAEKRSAEVKFLVTPDVKRRLQDEAKTSGVDLATYCRGKDTYGATATTRAVRNTRPYRRTRPAGKQPEPTGTDRQLLKKGMDGIRSPPCSCWSGSTNGWPQRYEAILSGKILTFGQRKDDSENRNR